MDQVLTGFSFPKCYIEDNLILGDYLHHLHAMFIKLKEHNLKLHLGKCWFFHTQVEYLGHMIYLGGLGVQKVRLKPFHRFPNQQMLAGYDVSWVYVITIRGLWKALVT